MHTSSSSRDGTERMIYWVKQFTSVQTSVPCTIYLGKRKHGLGYEAHALCSIPVRRVTALYFRNCNSSYCETCFLRALRRWLPLSAAADNTRVEGERCWLTCGNILPSSSLSPHQDNHRWFATTVYFVRSYACDFEPYQPSSTDSP